ncbi:isocitrate lyase/PEP mutase family protein [Agaricicola taiwanensis]|uniref:isocitrate lyase/PEP mutase family protein n=1 Tax=Agaricicola taiwanensis TaxID=591372 RepID=UPI001666C591|nr:isocitrate lyase/phosphoenolpyruvate mutase family protein [Agaricicola taiwanensis]
MKATDRRERLRAILTGERCVMPASVHDPLSARLAQSLGFEAGMFAGSVASLMVLGAPDLAVITLTEFAEQARRITRATDLPIIADADHGYGNALSVARTVEELEYAGVAALTIEDTELPQAFGAKGARVIPLAEGVGKMRAAVSARDDAALIVVARTGASSISGIDDAVTRCKAYQDTGVDALFLSGVESRDHLEKLCAVARVPVLLGAMAPDVRDLDYLSGLGVRVALQGHWPLRAAISAIRDTMTALKGNAAYAGSDTAASAALMAELSHDAHYKKATKDFLND